MASIDLGCADVVVVTQPVPRFTVRTPVIPTTIIFEPTPKIVVKNQGEISVTVEKPDDQIHLVVPIKGPPGPPGPPGDGESSASFRHTYVNPVELPDNSRTLFTVPGEYAMGTLAVFLNGLQEFHITQLTPTTFSFETAPFSSDTIKLDFNASS